VVLPFGKVDLEGLFKKGFALFEGINQANSGIRRQMADAHRQPKIYTGQELEYGEN